MGVYNSNLETGKNYLNKILSVENILFLKLIKEIIFIYR